MFVFKFSYLTSHFACKSVISIHQSFVFLTPTVCYSYSSVSRCSTSIISVDDVTTATLSKLQESESDLIQYVTRIAHTIVKLVLFTDFYLTYFFSITGQDSFQWYTVAMLTS